MSSSSSEVMPQGEGEKEGGGSIVLNWVDSLLGKVFFERCCEHHDLQKNELNRYCISCDESICKYCIISGSHLDHKILTIYRHVYQNVVPLSEMENHINCHKIQPYKCNKKWVVSLCPLPHNGSGSLLEETEACHVCKRKLTDSNLYDFCSVACKVQSNSGRLDLLAASQQKEEEEEEVEHTLRKRPRKGVPLRAPLF